MRLSVLSQALGFALPSHAHDVEISGIAYDSRQVKEGDLFVVWRGVHSDGRDFIGQALERGAKALCIEGEIPPGIKQVPCLWIENARLALADLAKTFYGDPSHELRVIGITGTNGKTTVSLLVESILERVGDRPGLLGTLYYKTGARLIPSERTTPEALEIQKYMRQMLDGGSRAVVMEVSSHALHQGRTRGVCFDGAIFTNLSQDHLDYHHNLEQYFLAKTLLFKDLHKDSVAVINKDDPYGARLVEMIPPPAKSPKADFMNKIGPMGPLAGGGMPSARVVTYGLSPVADVSATLVSLTATGSVIEVVYPEGKTQLQLKLVGRFNVYNALAAFSVLWAMGVDLEAVRQGLEQFEGVPGRMQFVAKGPVQVVVDYAHTENALQNVLATLRPVVSGRLITVFGCGGDRDRTKRPRMGEVVGRFSDFVVVTSDNPRSEDPFQILLQIEEGLKKTKTSYERVADRREAIEFALGEARPGDLVLIAGKGHEKFQEIAHARIPFDDVAVVEDLLKCGVVG